MCDCNQNTDPCAQAPCVPTETCDCPVKDLKSDCIIFTADLNCTNIKAGLTLTETLVGVDSAICDIKDEILNNIGNLTTIVNVGLGKKVYKGTDTLGRKQLRTVDKTGNLITVTENVNTVDISIDETALTDFIKTNQKSYDINNVGSGTKIYQEPDPTPVGNLTTFNFKTLKSDHLTFTETATEVKINTPISDLISVGTGVAVLNNINNTVAEISSIESSSLVVAKKTDGTITIDQPDFSGVKNFYVNSNYTPTTQFPANGSLSRPYPTFEEARTAFIGTGTIIAPQYSGSKIIIQTDSTAVNNPSINYLRLSFENGSTLTYIGTDLYMLDSEILYPLIPKTAPRNNLNTPIFMSLSGNGKITRTNGIGLVRGIGANRNGLGQVGDNSIIILLGENTLDEIQLKERSSYPSSIYDGDVTMPDGTTYQSIYGTQHKYTTQLDPTTPLIFTEFDSKTPLTFVVHAKGRLIIETVANTAIQIGQDTLFFAEKVEFKVNPYLVATTSGTKLVDRPYVYNPKPNRNFVEGVGRYYVKETIMDDSAGYSHIGVDNFFKFTNNAYFDYGILNLYSNIYVNKFLNISDVTNTYTSISVANQQKGSIISLPQARYFIDTNQSTLTVIMPHSNIKGFSNKTVSAVVLIADTQGTISSFLNVPVMSGISNYANDAAATTAGLIKNSLYFNTTTNAVDIT